MREMEIIEPGSLSSELQKHVKDGNPLIVTKYRDEKTGEMKGKDGRIIWDNQDFVFIQER